MFGDTVGKAQLDGLKHELLAEIRRLQDRIEQLEHDLKRERQTRKEETEGIWEDVGVLKATKADKPK